MQLLISCIFYGKARMYLRTIVGNILRKILRLGSNGVI